MIIYRFQIDFTNNVCQAYIFSLSSFCHFCHKVFAVPVITGFCYWFFPLWQKPANPVQNTLARVVAQKPRFFHITPVLADLHWLPIRHKINLKIASIAFKVLHFQQPSYLAALVPRYVPTRSLRSPSSSSICIPSRKIAMAGPSRSHPLPRTLGIGYHIIFHPFPLFLLSGRDSSIIFFQVLSPVFPLHPLTTRFVFSLM